MWICPLCGVSTDAVYFYKNQEICWVCYRVKKEAEPQHCKHIEVDYQEEEKTRTCQYCHGVWNSIRGLNMHLTHGCKNEIQKEASSD